jgi:hypothetical protein
LDNNDSRHRQRSTFSTPASHSYQHHTNTIPPGFEHGVSYYEPVALSLPRPSPRAPFPSIREHPLPNHSTRPVQNRRPPLRKTLAHSSPSPSLLLPHHHHRTVTIIAQHTPRVVDLLVTCHLVHAEVRALLKRQVEQPVRYFVDYSAVWAPVSSESALRGCLSVLDGEASTRYANEPIGAFVNLCRQAVSDTRWTNATRRIEMSITYSNTAVYGREVLETMIWLAVRTYLAPMGLLVVCKAPLPRTHMGGAVADALAWQ